MWKIPSPTTTALRLFKGTPFSFGHRAVWWRGQGAQPPLLAGGWEGHRRVETTIHDNVPSLDSDTLIRPAKPACHDAALLSHLFCPVHLQASGCLAPRPGDPNVDGQSPSSLFLLLTWLPLHTLLILGSFLRAKLEAKGNKAKPTRCCLFLSLCAAVGMLHNNSCSSRLAREKSASGSTDGFRKELGTGTRWVLCKNPTKSPRKY